jgi:hypothetical protein
VAYGRTLFPARAGCRTRSRVAAWRRSAQIKKTHANIAARSNCLNVEQDMMP